MSNGEREGWPRRHNLPDRIGPYEILGELGGGGMATVYLARTMGVGGFHRLFAVKRIHEHLSSDEAFAQMFVNEARIAARIHHPGIVSVFDVGEEDGRLHIAMEYLRGETLSFILNRAWKGGPGMPHTMMAHLIASACDALHLAHELRDDRGEFLGVIHRDLSPRNMMIGYDGFLRVLDFGVAKAENQYPKTRTGTQKGTVAYMAPEQILGKNLDRRLDIFALGIVLWESTVGKRLFAAPNDFATAAKVRQAQIPPPTGIRADYPPTLERIVLKALRREPEERYQTARELGDALRMFLTGNSQLIASTDVSDLVHRLCTDRLERRLEMERFGLRRLESDIGEGLDSSGIISLRASAALPREPVPVAPSRDRTDQMDGNAGAVLTTQNFLRDQTVAEPLTQNAEAPTAQGYPAVKLGVAQSFEPLTLQSDAVIKIADGDGTFKTFHGEPATDHLVKSHNRRTVDDETLEDRTDQGRAPLNGPDDVELSIDEVSLSEAPPTNDERLHLEGKESTERENQRPSVASEEETLRGESQPPPAAPNPILDAADAALDLFLEGTPQRPSIARSATPMRTAPPPRTETPLRPLTPVYNDPTLPPRTTSPVRPPAPPPISGMAPPALRSPELSRPSGLLELDPDLLEELSAETAPPIDNALAALASTSQLDGHDPFLDISQPKFELGAGEGKRRSASRPGTPAAPDRPVTAVIFRAASAQARSEAEAQLMGTDGLEPSRVAPMVEGDSAGAGAKILLVISVIVALGAFGAVKGPALMRRISGPAEAAQEAPPVEPTSEAADPNSEVAPTARAEPTPAEAPAPVAPRVEAAAVEVEEIELSFELEPTHAVVFLAGDPVESTVRRPKSSSSVHVEVSAPGYRSKERRIVLDRSQKLSFVLERETTPEAPAPAPEPARASPRKKKRGR